MPGLNRCARTAADRALRSIATAILLAFLGLAAASPALGVVAIRRADYHGWKGAYRMTNGTVDLVFVPQIGRVMRYGYVGKPNALWENPALFGTTVDLKNPPKDWTNFGGEKLWPAPQDRSGWPPDVELDAGSQRVEVLKVNVVRMTGKASGKLHIRFVREFEMSPNGSEVTISNSMLKVTDTFEQWSIWEVTQADSPVGIEMKKTYRYRTGYRPWPDAKPEPGTVNERRGKIWLTRSKTQGGKIGGPQTITPLTAYVKGGQFSVWADNPEETSGFMPDDGCAQQLWSNPDPLKYMELELLSPIRLPSTTGRHRFVTHWKLAPSRSQ